MGNPKGFMEVGRKVGGYRPVDERIKDFSEVEQNLDEKDRIDQASRCMDCGVPFCTWGCPLGNVMPEWQDAIYHDNWEKAIEIMHSTNNFPEFTGRICPALCENSCVLNIHEEPVTIRDNERAIVEKAFEMGLIKPNPPEERTGKKVAVIGGGPAGMACADLLNKWGHEVTLFEKTDAVGGLLRYGIPDFKLNKKIIDRRLKILEEEGLKVKANTEVGVDISGEELLKKFDAVCLTIGAMEPRDLPIEGRELKGIYFAMDFLKQQNALVRGIKIDEKDLINAKGKNVLVIGGGDTGSDCVGTSVRQGAKSILQVEILPKPSQDRPKENPWPFWPRVLRTSSSHQEGCERRWNILTKKFIGENGQLKQVEIAQVDWTKEDGKHKMVEQKGTNKVLPIDLVFLAMGFVHPVHKGLVDEFSLELDQRGNIKTNENHQSSNKKVFAAGDSVSGASLVVHAINMGRKAADSIDRFLMKK